MYIKPLLLSSVILILAAGCSKQERKDAMKWLSSLKPEPKVEKPTKSVVSGVTNGIPEVEFIKVFGDPKGKVASEGEVKLFYDDFQVTVRNGTVHDIPEDLIEMYPNDKSSALEKIKDTKISIPAPKELKAALAKRKAYPLTNSNGEPVDHSELVTTGKVTVVQFFLEETTTCERIGEKIKGLVKDYEGVELRTVYIAEWNSEVSKRFHISSIPDIRILDAYGNLVSQPITRIEKVDGLIDLSRVKEAIEQAL